MSLSVNCTPRISKQWTLTLRTWHSGLDAFLRVTSMVERSNSLCKRLSVACANARAQPH